MIQLSIEKGWLYRSRRKLYSTIFLHFLFLPCRFGRVQSVKILKQKGGGDHHGLDACTNATVAFMDIKSANKAHSVEHKLEDRLLRTDYYDPSSSNSLQHYNTNTSSSTTGNSVGAGSNSSSSLNSRLHPEDGPGPGPGPGGGGASGVTAGDLYNENHNRSSHFVGDRLGGSGSSNTGGSIRDRIGERGSSGGTPGSNMPGSDFFPSSNSSNLNSSSHRNSNNERRYGQDEDFSRQRSVRSAGYRSQAGYNSDK